MFNQTHRRYNPLLGEWVLVSPHRGTRPWQGQEDESVIKHMKAYDSGCYLCPGNERAGGVNNPQYSGPFVFINDFSAIPSDAEAQEHNKGLFQVRSETGICKVVCFSEDHSITIPEMSLEDVEAVIKVWIQETYEMQQRLNINHIQIFENKGAIMGCSNPHPHCQIWAQESIPNIVVKEDIRQSEYYHENGKTLLEDYTVQEKEKNERIVYENDHFICVVPFWAVWPFETLIISKRAQANISDMNPEEITAFAEIYKTITCKYDNIFSISFPYSAGIHQAPFNIESKEYWNWHMHFYPPLFRSAEVKKFMVGYEMLAEPQRDLTAEQAAEIIKKQETTHYPWNRSC